MKAVIIVLLVCLAVCSGNYLQDLKMWDPSFCCYPVPSGCCPECLECIDVAFILDDSSSITPAQFAQIQVFLNSLTSDPRLPSHPDLQTAMVQFARTATLVWNWGAHASDAEYLAAVASDLTQGGGFTKPITGMEMVQNSVLGSAGDRPECPNTCVIITDGLAQNTVAQLQAAGDTLREQCGSVFVLGVTINVPPQGVADFAAQLLAMAGNNPDYVFNTDDFSGLIDLFEGVIDMWCDEFGSGSSGDCCPFDYIYLVSKKPNKFW